MRENLRCGKWVAAALVVLGLAYCCPVAKAAILGTYVDASTSTNTAPLSAFAGSQVHTDQKWWDRPLGGFNLNNNTVIEATLSEDTPVITTTVTGLTSGEYAVYVLYWTFLGSADKDQGIAAALGADPLVEYWRTDGVSFSTGIKHPDTTTTELYQVKIGTFTGTSFAVNVDHAGSSLSGVSDERTWYDGVAYVEIPEPAMIGALAIFPVLVCRRRCRR